MPQVRFEPTMTAFERANTVHALDRTATVIALFCNYTLKIFRNFSGKLIEFFLM
jgi:hypothetical protein